MCRTLRQNCCWFCCIQGDNVAGVAAAKSVDLRERLRGMEPASDETLQRTGCGFPSKRRRRHRRL